jgi:hypothetical protein
MGQALALNVNGVLRDQFNPVVWGTPTTPGFAYLAGKFWTVKEEVITAYLRGDLNHDISDSVSLRGNVGVQVLYTDQSSDSSSYRRDGYGVTTARTTPTSCRRSTSLSSCRIRRPCASAFRSNWPVPAWTS